MSVNDQYALNWSNHTSHIRKAFDTLLSENQFVDVTLSCEGKKVVAHKIILSACSTYFHDLFRDNPCQHPIVILKDVKFQNLIDILKFIYNGEVSVSSDNFDSFLKTAELLQISGLTDDDSKQLDEASSAIESNETPTLETTSINLKSSPQPSQSTSTSITHQIKSPPITKKRPIEVTQSEEPAVLKKKRESSGLDIEIKEEISESNFEEDELNSIIDIKDPLQLEQQQEEPDLTETLPIAQQSYPEVKDLLINAHKLPTSSNTDHNSIVLRKLNAIIRKLELVDGRLHSLTIKNLGIEDNAEFEETEGFLPISDDEGLTNFEHRLKHEPGFRPKMISVLKSIGGQNLVSVTCGIMRRIWTNSLASTYSMLGRKQKKIFRNLSTYKLVIDTVRVHRPNATEDQIQEAIAKWLVHAPVRHTRTKPKEDASPASTAI